MKDEPIIRSITPQDIKNVIELLEETGLFVKGADSFDAIMEKVRYDSRSIVVAEVDKKIVGSVFAVYDPWVSLVFHLCVKEDYRNKGIAGLLTNEVESRCLGYGACNIAGYIDQENDASRRLAAKSGYVEWPHPVICVIKRFKPEG